MSGPLILKCAACQHCAPLPRSVAQLINKTLVCSKCGARHKLDLGEVIKAIYAEESATEGRALH